MTDIAETAIPEVDPEKKAITLLARALWRTELRASSEEVSAEDAKQNWKDNRGDKIKQARRLMKAIKKQGLDVTLAPAETA